MKNLIPFLFLALSISGFSHVHNDTITNWQVYKDEKLLFRSHDFNSNHYTANIKTTDPFINLRIYISSDMRNGETKRKLLLKQGDKLVYTFIRILKSSEDPVIITNSELKKIIGPSVNQEFRLEYSDDDELNTNVIGNIMLTDN